MIKLYKTKFFKTFSFLLGSLLLTAVLLAAGCSSWESSVGGKMNNTEGVNFYSRGQYEQALASFQTAARLNPEDSEVYYNIASTYQQQALRYQDPTLLTLAENNYRKCLDMNPTPETTVCCYRGLATVLNQKKEDDKALEVLKTWENKDPNAMEPKLEIAYLLEAQGKNDQAAEILKQVKEWAPNDYRAFYKLGLVEEKLGNDEAALEELRTAARLKPEDTEIAQKVTAFETKIRQSEAADAAAQASAGQIPTPSAFDNSASAAGPLESAKAVSRSTSTAPAFTSPSQASNPGNQDTGLFAPMETGSSVRNAETAPAPAFQDEGSSFSSEESPSYNLSPREALPAEALHPENSDAIDAAFAPDDSFPFSPMPEESTPLPNANSGNNSGNNSANPSVTGTTGELSELELPDGTGSNSFKVAMNNSQQTAAPPAPIASNASAPATAERKSTVGEYRPGPPPASVGSPF